ncbi:lipase secretion chaperone [Halopseudomonas nanhaiensis]|uniref:lipase secretion chaperone n=1 Tax=Halopseudomonas nanhaiensis TaxID=2830842 RepID=UPI001CBC0210|nr:lipase secretion chaperone [Halopseudomonas nanhaiensis]UAW98557.1 lipase secretion chaperone [Halopseudomonas nanhaiensis]
MKAIVYAPLLGCILLLGWHLTRPAVEVAELSPALQAPRSTLQQVSTRPAATSAIPRQAPASLRGTEVDGTLQTDHRGHLLVTEQLRDLFEYYLATIGEVQSDQAVEMIRQQLAAQLNQPALTEAYELLDAYLEYKQRVAALEQDLPVVADLAALAEREEAVRRLRAELFDPLVHEALFGREEQYNQYHLERLAILHDSELDETGRALALEELRQRQPDALRDSLAVQLHQQLGERTRALQAEGAPPQAVRQLRLELVGPEATERLEQLDQERARWQQRLDQFAEERQAILADPGLADQDKQAAVSELLADRFDERERMRVATLID